MLQIKDFDYHLPKALIAQNPLKNKEEARLMVLNRKNQSIEHRGIGELPECLSLNDVLVFNDTKVIRARLHGKIENNTVELLLHREINENTWECLVKPGKRFQKGQRIEFHSKVAQKAS